MSPAEIDVRAWQDRQNGKIERRHGLRATATTDMDELRHLCAVARNGADAHAMWMLFQGEHDARLKRGKGFRITPKAMVKLQSLGPYWTAARYRAARDVLLEHGYIEIMSEGTSKRGSRAGSPGPRRLASSETRSAP